MHIEYFRIAIRSLTPNKLYVGINRLGLTLSLPVVMLIGLFLLDEWTFDTFHQPLD